MDGRERALPAEHVELRPTAAQLALIYDTVSDPIMLFAVGDGPPRIESANPAACRMLRTAPGDLVGKQMRELTGTTRGQQEFDEAIERVALSHASLRYESNTTYRGQRIAVIITLHPIIDVDGVCRHVLSVSRDITQEAAVLEALRASEQNLEATLRSIGDGVIATDVDGHVVRMNTHAEVTTG